MAIEITGHLGKNLVRMAEGDEMASAADGMPDGSGGLVCHRSIDGFRQQFVIRSLPEVDRSHHFIHIEGPGFVEHRGVGDKPLSALWQTFARCIQKGLAEHLI
ncbi:hypothetical protein [Cyanobium gracile]|uniref:Uncharacterized protein n=1 Tax=Cyanobium gracile UHCC 0281 TaxID=3110309 RepID=A0ABU5SYG0_9CYAN|nr:hypothetical protein [Cyanobium gracile]MEA5443557.1 hypothetical protein [Cyanobium gracile UHCC 0281]